MKISRGLRNNNPLNIRRNGTKWKGLSEIQSDKEFFSFIDACWGYRAAFITLRNYFLRHSLKTLRGWINRWAPPVENDTENYVRFVAGKSAVMPMLNYTLQMHRLCKGLYRQCLGWRTECRQRRKTLKKVGNWRSGKHAFKGHLNRFLELFALKGGLMRL